MLPSGNILRKFHATDGIQNKQMYKKWYMFRPKLRAVKACPTVRHKRQLFTVGIGMFNG
jgi:hypothetical protein